MEKKHCFPSDSSDPLYLLHNVGMKPCELRSSLLFLEINENHKIADKLKHLYETDKEALKDYTKILYAQARLIEGLPIDNPTEITNLICNVISDEKED